MTDERDCKKVQKSRSKATAIGLTAGIVIGFAIGAAAGVATGQYPLWIGCIGIPIGAGLGWCIGLAISGLKAQS